MSFRMTSLGLALWLAGSAPAFGENCDSWFCGWDGLRGSSGFEEVAKLEYEESRRVLREYQGLEPEIQERLVEYQQRVAATSYRDTLRLCVAYRKYQGYGETHSSELGDSLKAWAELVAHGLYQPLDGMIGLKSDYLEMTGAGLFDFSNYFRSMYVLKFLQSAGFLYGAAHCLNTVDSREIEKFASRILLADYWASGAVEVASGSAVSAILAKTVGWWVLRPLRRMLAGLNPTRFRPAIVLSAGSMAILLGDGFNCRRILADLDAENLAGIGGSNEHGERQKRVRAAVEVAQAYDSFQTTCGAHASPDFVEPRCASALKKLVATLTRTRFVQMLSDYRRDLAQVSESELQRLARTCGQSVDRAFNDSSTGKLHNIYLSVLRILIPAVEKFNIPSH
jgi:hypothetical protein